MRRLIAIFGISQARENLPEDAYGLLDFVLPGFYPAVYP
jgi:hypothetical protein